MKNIFLLFFLFALVPALKAQTEVQKKIQRQMIMAEDNSTIELEEGTFEITGTLSLEGKKNITIKGKGMDKTILSFKNQTEGAEGMKISNGENIKIQDLTIQNSKGDAIKTMNIKGLNFTNVKTEWSQISKDNGSYGLYPVLCQDIVIDRCVAIGASDAGIYVGQSKNITVKNSKAYHNVAGIEIENSLNADVFDNESYENTGGVLVFDLPDLQQKKGGNVRVYRNNIHHNNLANFAPKGNIVANVPAGTGVMILATNQVEVFQNKILQNNSVGTSIVSYYMTENPIKDSLYYPYPTQIYVHDNEYSRDKVSFVGKGRFGLMVKFKLRFGKDVPDIMYDGILDDQRKEPHQICVRDNKNAAFVNIDAANNFKNVSRDASSYNCEGAKLEGNNNPK